VSTRHPELLEQIIGIAAGAGERIMAVYEQAFEVAHKADESPLTEADLAAHEHISAALGHLQPALPVLSEEAGLAPFGERRGWQRYWLVDPLDGTREFVKRNGEFTVNIALIEDHEPVLGVVLAPARGLTYAGAPGAALRIDAGGERTPIRVAGGVPARPRVVGSRSHRGSSLDGFLERLGDHELVPMGSSLKICLVADGSADVYPRLGPTSEWDTAAAHAVLRAAGGEMFRLDGRPLRYNTKEDILNPHFVACSGTGRHWLEHLPPA